MQRSESGLPRLTPGTGAFITPADSHCDELAMDTAI